MSFVPSLIGFVSKSQYYAFKDLRQEEVDGTPDLFASDQTRQPFFLFLQSLFRCLGSVGNPRLRRQKRSYGAQTLKVFSLEFLVLDADI